MSELSKEDYANVFGSFMKTALDFTEHMNNESEKKDKEIERLNNIINRTTKYVESLSSSGRGCDIYEDIKQEILKELKGSDKK